MCACSFIYVWLFTFATFWPFILSVAFLSPFRCFISDCTLEISFQVMFSLVRRHITGNRRLTTTVASTSNPINFFLILILSTHLLLNLIKGGKKIRNTSLGRIYSFNFYYSLTFHYIIILCKLLVRLKCKLSGRDNLFPPHRPPPPLLRFWEILWWVGVMSCYYVVVGGCNYICT
jgi:hypothetical protein